MFRLRLKAITALYCESSRPRPQRYYKGRRIFLNSNGDPLELGVEGESDKQRDTEEDIVRGVRVVVAMTIVMVMKTPLH